MVAERDAMAEKLDSVRERLKRADVPTEGLDKLNPTIEDGIDWLRDRLVEAQAKLAEAEAERDAAENALIAHEDTLRDHAPGHPAVECPALKLLERVRARRQKEKYRG